MRQFLTQHKSTTLNSLWRTLYVASRQGGTFILFFISARLLSPTELGTLSFIFSLLGLLLIFCDFGVSIAVTNYVANLSQIKSKEIEKVFYSISLYFIPVITVVALLTFLYVFFTNTAHSFSILVALPYLYLVPLSSVLDGVYRGYGLFRKQSLISLFTAIIAIPLSIPLIEYFGINGAIISQHIFFSFTTLGSIVFLFHKIKLQYSPQVAKVIMRNSWLIGLSSLSLFLYSRVDTIILNSYGFVEEIAYYEISNKFFRMLYIPYTILGQVIMLHTTKHFVSKNINKIYKKFIFHSILIFTFGSLVLAPFLFIVFPFILSLFLPQYSESNIDIIFNMLLIIFPLKSLTTFSSHAYLLPTQSFNLTLYGLIPFGVLNVLLNILFINSFGFIGVVYSTLICTILGDSVILFIFFKKIKSIIS